MPLESSDDAWVYWGKQDPLWAVAAWPGKEIHGPSPWTAAEFLQLGESDFADVERHWRHYGMMRGTCVEIGCGAGRITAQLVTAFAQVVALDVSPDQLRVAQELMGERSRRVTFHQVAGISIPMPDSSCVAMFSSHVFQHLVSFRKVVDYLRDTWRVLVPGGTACFHLPVPGAHRKAHRSFLRHALSTASVKIQRAMGRRRLREYHVYSPRFVFENLESLGFADLELRIFDMRSNHDAHSFFFARKT